MHSAPCQSVAAAPSHSLRRLVRLGRGALLGFGLHDRGRQHFIRDLLAILPPAAIRFDCGLPKLEGMEMRQNPETGEYYELYRDIVTRRAALDHAGGVAYYHDARTGMNLTYVSHTMSTWGTHPIGTCHHSCQWHTKLDCCTGSGSPRRQCYWDTTQSPSWARSRALAPATWIT